MGIRDLAAAAVKADEAAQEVEAQRCQVVNASAAKGIVMKLLGLDCTVVGAPTSIRADCVGHGCFVALGDPGEEVYLEVRVDTVWEGPNYHRYKTGENRTYLTLAKRSGSSYSSYFNISGIPSCDLPITSLAELGRVLDRADRCKAL